MGFGKGAFARANSEHMQRKKMMQHQSSVRKRAARYRENAARYQIENKRLLCVQMSIYAVLFIMSAVLILYTLSTSSTYAGGVWIKSNLFRDSTYEHQGSHISDVDNKEALYLFLKNTFFRTLFAEHPNAHADNSTLIRFKNTGDSDNYDRCVAHSGLREEAHRNTLLQQ